ncbi:MAG: type VI secretion system-associated protein TagF [Pseudomonadales bacterium]
MSTPHLAEPLVGFFGKLPSKGDFVKRSLPESFVGPYDMWLQQVLGAARESLGADDWLGRYLNSSIWRFCLPAGALDEQLWLGAVMPSVDKVGRYFPLTIAAALPASTDPIATIRANDAWFEQVETLLYRALDDESLDLEDFAAAVQLCAPLPTVASATVEQHNAWQVVELPASENAGAAPRLFDDLLAPLAGATLATNKTLWWAPAGARASLLIFDGLPSNEGYVRLLGDAVELPAVDFEPHSETPAQTTATVATASPDWMPEDIAPTEGGGRSLDEMFGTPAADSDDTAQLDITADPDDTKVLGDKKSPRPSLDSILADPNAKTLDDS